MSLAENILDWFGDNILPWLLILCLIAIFVLMICMGVWLYHDHKMPTTARTVAGKHQSTSHVFISTGKGTGYMSPITSYTLVSTDGASCSVSAGEFAIRKDGEMAVCKWYAP